MASAKKRRLADDVILYILPTKLQKLRLQCMVKSAEKCGFAIESKFSGRVTHVITELESQQDVIRKLLSEDGVWCDNVEIVSTAWFAASVRAKQPVSTEGFTLCERKQKEVTPEPEEESEDKKMYECMHATPLHHHNVKFTEALELLERYHEYRSDEQDYSRALAYRRCACVLKYMSHPLTSIQQVSRNKHIGKHCRQILQDLLDHNECQEIENIRQSDWFKKMELFTSVFGVGPGIGKKWISQGVSSINDAIERTDIDRKGDQRIAVGLAFHEDLNLAVSLKEAMAVKDYIQTKAEHILPGVTVELTGGFRRGKLTGHDVDLLISHPTEGCEKGLLRQLLTNLHQDNLVIFDTYQPNTYRTEILEQEIKSNLKNTLDHFEKWIGVIKIDKNVRGAAAGENESNCECHGKNTKVTAPDQTATDVKPISSETDDSHSEPSSSSRAKCKHCGKTRSCSIIPPSARKSTQDETAPSSSGDSLDQHIPEVSWRPGDLMTVANGPRDWFARRVDLIIAPASQYYYALVGWTGSKQFNRSLRLLASREHNMSLTSHALYDRIKRQVVPAESEQQVFDNLGVPYRHQHLRNC